MKSPSLADDDENANRYALPIYNHHPMLARFIQLPIPNDKGKFAGFSSRGVV